MLKYLLEFLFFVRCFYKFCFIVFSREGLSNAFEGLGVRMFYQLRLRRGEAFGVAIGQSITQTKQTTITTAFTSKPLKS